MKNKINEESITGLVSGSIIAGFGIFGIYEALSNLDYIYTPFLLGPSLAITGLGIIETIGSAVIYYDNIENYTTYEMIIDELNNKLDSLNEQNRKDIYSMVEQEYNNHVLVKK